MITIISNATGTLHATVSTHKLRTCGLYPFEMPSVQQLVDPGHAKQQFQIMFISNVQRMKTLIIHLLMYSGSGG